MLALQIYIGYLYRLHVPWKSLKSDWGQGWEHIAIVAATQEADARHFLEPGKAGPAWAT